MTHVKLSVLFLSVGVPCIGLAAAMLYALSFFVGAGDTRTLRIVATIGVLVYAGCVLAKFAESKEHENNIGA
jgi:hypothetical protein